MSNSCFGPVLHVSKVETVTGDHSNSKSEHNLATDAEYFFFCYCDDVIKLCEGLLDIGHTSRKSNRVGDRLQRWSHMAAIVRTSSKRL